MNAQNTSTQLHVLRLHMVSPAVFPVEGEKGSKLDGQFRLKGCSVEKDFPPHVYPIEVQNIMCESKEGWP